MRRLISVIFIGSILLLCLSVQAFAMNQEEAIQFYREELVKIGANQEDAQSIAETEIGNLINTMEAAQGDASDAYSEIKTRVNAIPKNDPRRDPAIKAKDDGKRIVERFTDMDPSKNIEVRSALGGVPPVALPNADFKIAQENALGVVSDLNRILLAPAKPGAVPEGDIIEDFIPQLIRQLFRFAWVAIFVALVTSGIFMIIAQDKEEMVTKAKQMITMSLIGFAFIALAFAIVKAVTNIDFFGFI